VAYTFTPSCYSIRRAPARGSFSDRTSSCACSRLDDSRSCTAAVLTIL